MKKIKLTRGKFALVDNCDFKKLNKFKWYAFFDGYNYYALRHTRMVNGKRQVIRMHRVVVKKIPWGMEVDHIDLNGLNNQRKNLKVCTHAHNMRNQGIRKNNTSGFKGITQSKYKTWVVRICVNGKRIYLGTFKDKKVAIENYNKAYKKHEKHFKLL